MKPICETILFLLFVVSCSNVRTSELKEKLSGEWKREGLYKDNEPIFDTLYTEYPNKGNEKDFEVIVISTDSGTYRHVYNQLTRQLIEINRSEIEIVNFAFDSDNTGKLLQYHAPGFDQKFELVERDSGIDVIFHNLDETIDTTKVVKLNNRNLEIQWPGGYVEKFIKNMPLTSQ